MFQTWDICKQEGRRSEGLTRMSQPLFQTSYSPQKIRNSVPSFEGGREVWEVWPMSKVWPIFDFEGFPKSVYERTCKKRFSFNIKLRRQCNAMEVSTQPECARCSQCNFTFSLKGNLFRQTWTVHDPDNVLWDHLSYTNGFLGRLIWSTNMF